MLRRFGSCALSVARRHRLRCESAQQHKSGFAVVAKVKPSEHSQPQGSALTLSSKLTYLSSAVLQHDVGAVARLATGDRLLLRRTFTAADALSFARLTGDTNPLHATSTPHFAAPIVPGMLTAALFSAVFGSTLPGAVYVRQEVQFVRPLLFEQEVEATVTINSIKPRQRRSGTSRAAAAEATEGVGLAGQSQAEGQQQQRDEPFAALVECSTEVSRLEDGKLIVKGSASVIVPKCQLRT